MKKLIFCLLATMAALYSYSQISITNELIVRDSQRIAGVWISGIVLDTSFNDATVSKIPSAKAVEAYVKKETSGLLQSLDTSDLSGNNLRLSLSSDGEAVKQIDLSQFLDGGVDSVRVRNDSLFLYDAAIEYFVGFNSGDLQSTYDRSVIKKIDVNNGSLEMNLLSPDSFAIQSNGSERFTIPYSGNIKIAGTSVYFDDQLDRRIWSNYIGRGSGMVWNAFNFPGSGYGSRYLRLFSGDEDGGITMHSTAAGTANQYQTVFTVRRGTAGVNCDGYVKDGAFCVKFGGHNTNRIVRFMDASENTEYEMMSNGLGKYFTGLDFDSLATFTLPKMTNTGRALLTGLETGDLIFNTEHNRHEKYDGTVWRPLGNDNTYTISTNTTYEEKYWGAKIYVNDSSDDDTPVEFALPGSPVDGMSFDFILTSATNTSGGDSDGFVFDISVNGFTGLTQQYSKVHVEYVNDGVTVGWFGFVN